MHVLQKKIVVASPDEPEIESPFLEVQVAVTA
jgi:hypothetical protein